jgi:hypothetical protein
MTSPALDHYVAASYNLASAANPTTAGYGPGAGLGTRLPRKGDLLVAFGGANNQPQYPTAFEDDAAGSWVAGAASPMGVGQTLATFLAVAPRDYTSTDAWRMTWTQTGNQKATTIRGISGLPFTSHRDLAAFAQASGNANNANPTTGPAGRVPALALLLGSVQVGGAGGSPAPSWGAANAVSWQAAANQWQMTTLDLTTAQVPDLSLTATIIGSQVWAAVVMALLLPVPLKVWDGADWLPLAVAGTRAWTGQEWRPLQ